jgi:hypothetical protein
LNEYENTIINYCIEFNKSCLAIIGLNYSDIHKKQIDLFKDLYKINFIPLKNFEEFKEENFILENFLAFCLVKKIKKITLKSNKMNHKADEENYEQNVSPKNGHDDLKYNKTDNEKDNIYLTKICKVKRTFSGKV